MLRSIFNCAPLMCTLMLASVTLTACGGGSGASGVPNTGDQSTLSGTIDRNVDNGTVEDASTDAGSTVEDSGKQNTSLSAISSSVRNLTETTKSSVPTQSVAKSVASSSAKAVLTTSNTTVNVNSSVKAIAASSAPLSTKSSVSTNSKASSSAVATVSSKASSSVKATSSIKASSSSKTSSSTRSKAASSISIAGILGADIEWTPPTARENGTYLTLDEIGGYQIRFRALNSDEYTYIQLPGNSHRKYKFPKSIVGLQFEIAVYDNQGLYSDFVPINSK